jgi:uncharacterized protein YifE (UPF0438 family)
MHYLDDRLFFYKSLSREGKYYYQENELLEKLSNNFKDKIKRNEQITSFEQDSFLNYLEGTFRNSQYVDFEKYNELKKLPFKTDFDVDFVKGYIKNCFVYILQDN